MSNEENNHLKQTGDREKRRKPFINTSGMGNRAQVPSVVKNKFNWGAFLLGWIWGIGNKTYITLIYVVLWIIPLVNLGVSIWFGIKGNEWAWRNKRFESISSFHAIQKNWVIGGIVFWIIFLPIMYFILIFGLVFGTMHTAIKNPEEADKVMTKLENIMENTALTYFETYSIEENENKFYIIENDWEKLDFQDRKNLIDIAAQMSASKREKAFKEAYPNRYKSFSKVSELNRTRIYSANDRNKLLGEFYMDNNLYNGNDTKFTDILKAGMTAYKFYSPNDNAQAQPVQQNYNNDIGYEIHSEDTYNLKKCYAGLNQAILLNEALNGDYITQTSNFINMFTTRMNVIPERTTNDSFTTSDNNNFKIIPLKETCNQSNTVADIGEDSACAKVMINDKFILYLYSDGVFTGNNSTEKQIIGK